MADLNNFIPFVLRWSAGTVLRRDESLEDLFNRAKRNGWSKHPLDRGGATQCDITIATYRTYRKRKGLPTPTEDDLRNISFHHWRDILKSMYWDRWQADRIENQSLAELLVDWVWASGEKSIKSAQTIIGVSADGIAGEKTLDAINRSETKHLFSRLHKGRVNYVKEIAKRNPSQKIWLQGWLNRINNISYRA